MPLPRPASPRFLWQDMKAFWANRPRHQWVAAVLAVLIPIAIVAAFYVDSGHNVRPVQTIYYVNSWPVSRTDEEIKAKQRADQAEREARERARQQEFQRLDDQLNRLGI